MRSDDRELRLRSNFGFMMVWTALTIAIIGYLLGILLEAAFGAAGFVFGFASAEWGQSVQAAGHVLVGMAVVLGIVQSYLAPDGLPDAEK
ncbi:MAG: hypothetical protein ACXWVT_00045 [Burkholderiaceae bacterium]